MDYEFYITPEEYAAAEKNGISRRNLERRIRVNGWTKQKAINTPLQKMNNRKKWAEIAKANGIGYSTFASRINYYNWSPERAATEPLLDKRELAKQGAEASRKFPKEMVELAEKNRISYHVFRSRVIKGWDLTEAATTPMMSLSEAGKRGKQSALSKYGDINKVVFKTKRQ